MNAFLRVLLTILLFIVWIGPAGIAGYVFGHFFGPWGFIPALIFAVIWGLTVGYYALRKIARLWSYNA